MSNQLIDGIWVVVCDWKDPETGKPCDLGVAKEPKMFVDPDGGRTADKNKHFQCGAHHGVMKQEDKPEFQLPEGHKLLENSLVQEGAQTEKIKKITLEGFKPDVEGKVWKGK